MVVATDLVDCIASLHVPTLHYTTIRAQPYHITSIECVPHLVQKHSGMADRIIRSGYIDKIPIATDTGRYVFYLGT